MSTSTEQARRKSRADEAVKREWVDKINERFGNQTRSIFDTGDILVEAKQALVDKDFREVVKATGIKTFKTADNYMRVARNEYLRKPGIFEHLPPTVGTLIDLAVWEEEMLLKAIKADWLNPQATRSDLHAWFMATKFNLGPRRNEFKKDIAEPYADWPVGHIIADYRYYLNADLMERTERLKAFVNAVNSAAHDFGFILATDDTTTHFAVRRQGLEAKIKRQYRFHGQADFEQDGMAAIFGNVWEFHNRPWIWETWVPKFVDAWLEGGAPFINLTPDEIAFIRCQTAARRPFPNPNVGWGQERAPHSLESFMADDEPTRYQHNLERFLVGDGLETKVEGV